MSRVTLVNPQVSIVGWNASMGSLDNGIRMGLAYLSSALKADGHDVKLIDLRTLKGWEEYDAMVSSQSPDVLGVTMHTVEYNTAIECCRRAKKVNPKIVTIVGGIHPTIAPDECLDTGVVDHVMKGEGEITFPKFVRTPNDFPPSFWGESPDLDKIPFPDRELWPDHEKRTQFSFFNTFKRPFLPPTIEMITGRGCPYPCRFCCGPGEQNLYSIEFNGKRVPHIRQRSVENVMKELTELYDKYKFRSIVFHDDQFVINTDRAAEFCEAMHSYGFVEKGVKFWAASRADIIRSNPELFAKLKDAGLNMLSVGFESFSDRMLEWIKKGTTVEDNFEAVKILRKIGIQIYGNFIFGIPYSDGKWYKEDDMKNADAIRTIKPDITSYSFFTPVPGSDLYEFCKERGLIIESSSLGSRSPNEGKIKGVDYEYLNKLTASVIPKRGPLKTVPIAIIRKLGLYNTALSVLTRLHGFGQAR